MGFSLEPVQADFYMCHLENKILEYQKDLRKSAYSEWHFLVHNIYQVLKLGHYIITNSALKFTYELEKANSEKSFKLIRR